MAKFLCCHSEGTRRVLSAVREGGGCANNLSVVLNSISKLRSPTARRKPRKSCQAALHGCLPADTKHQPRQTRCVGSFFFATDRTYLSRQKTRRTHGTRKTRHKTSRSPKEVSQAHKRLFPHQEQAVPVCAGGRQSRGPLCVPRSPRKKARVSPPVDSAHRRRRAPERLDLRATHSRP